MKARTITAATVAAGAVVCFTVIPAVSSASTSDLGWLTANKTALKSSMQGSKDQKAGMDATAAADELVAWRTIRYAPIPTDPNLRTARAHALIKFASYYRADLAYERNDLPTGNAYMATGNKQADLSNAALTLYVGSL